MVLGGEETAGQQDLRSQSEPASETAYSQEEDTSQTAALSAVTRLVSKIENTRKPGEFQLSFSDHCLECIIVICVTSAGLFLLNSFWIYEKLFSFSH